MNLSGVNQLSSQLQLQRTHKAHYPSRDEIVSQPVRTGGDQSVTSTKSDGGFAGLLRDGLESVNQAQQTHEALAAQAIINPDQVDAHDVTIAAAKADLSIRLARNIIDRTLNAYREITSLR